MCGQVSNTLRCIAHEKITHARDRAGDLPCPMGPASPDHSLETLMVSQTCSMVKVPVLDRLLLAGGWIP